MTSISFRLFRNLRAIPHSQMVVLKQYMYSNGTFSAIIDDYDSEDDVSYYTIHNILVMYDDKHPIGWCMHWTEKGRRKSCLGFWVDKKLRGKGLGKMLCKEAFRRWYDLYNPKTFSDVEYYIWPKLMKEASLSK